MTLEKRLRTLGLVSSFALALIMCGWRRATPLLAAEAPTCPNEQLRDESRESLATQRPYDLGLRECRAYEMVSPQQKGGYSAAPPVTGLPVSPEGNAVGFQSQGAFAGAGNVVTAFSPFVTYIGRRTPSGWTTETDFAPAGLIASPFLREGLFSDYSPDLTSAQVNCGRANTESAGLADGVRCAYRRTGSAWAATPIYDSVSGALFGGQGYLGASADLSRIFLQPAETLLASDSAKEDSRGIYEIADADSPSPEIRLVNLDNNGTELTMPGGLGPLLGDQRSNPGVAGSDYQAVSESGETVFFTAAPAGGVQTVYARVHHAETVAVSNPTPSECDTCGTAPDAATYEGASANGSKVFFITAQQLLNSDGDTTPDLYMYDFNGAPGKNLVQLSAGGIGDLTPGIGANVEGVMAVSSDGSHVDFVATGALTNLPNSLGQFAQSEADNLYEVDTNTGGTKFIAELCSGEERSGSASDSSCDTEESDEALWGREGEEPNAAHIEADTTPEGQYLVFSTWARLTAEDNDAGRAVYRYDFETGELTWVSHGAEGFSPTDDGRNAVLAASRESFGGAERDVSDWNRAITNDGSDVIFTTSERLQPDDVNGANDVYLWHDGTVSLISDGEWPKGVDSGLPYVGISASGDDIFFLTRTQLVGQDRDVLQDMYDARVGGGFPAPKEPAQCEAEGSRQESMCQGAGSGQPAPLKPEGSSTQLAGDNLTPPPFSAVVEPEPAGVVRITKHTSTTLSIKVPGKGTVSLSGAGVHSLKLSVQKAGTYNLKLTLTAHEQALVREKRSAKVDVRVGFIPATGGHSVAKATISVMSKARR
jgi:hypothetical protein